MPANPVKLMKREQVGVSLSEDGRRCMNLLANIHGLMVGDMVENLIRRMVIETLPRESEFKQLAFGSKRPKMDEWFSELKRIVES